MVNVLRVDWMSGTETLIPFMNDKKKKGEEPTIIVDSREASSAEKIVKGLVERESTLKLNYLRKATTFSQTNVRLNVKPSTILFTPSRGGTFSSSFSGLKKLTRNRLSFLKVTCRSFTSTAIFSPAQFGVRCLI